MAAKKKPKMPMKGQMPKGMPPKGMPPKGMPTKGTMPMPMMKQMMKGH